MLSQRQRRMLEDARRVLESPPEAKNVAFLQVRTLTLGPTLAYLTLILTLTLTLTLILILTLRITLTLSPTLTLPLLQRVALLTRAMSGGRVTMCKSGEDCTSNPHPNPNPIRAPQLIPNLTLTPTLIRQGPHLHVRHARARQVIGMVVVVVVLLLLVVLTKSRTRSTLTTSYGCTYHGRLAVLTIAVPTMPVPTIAGCCRSSTAWRPRSWRVWWPPCADGVCAARTCAHPPR